MTVYIDGSLLSSLLFSHLNSSGSQYGFLIGERVEHIEDRISDSQIHTSDVNSFIYVSSFVSWPTHEYIYNRSGHFNDEAVHSLLKNTKQNLIGWYSFRHNTSLRPSLQEITLHNNLVKMKQLGGEPQDFLFFLCTSSFSHNNSTHLSSHSFMHVVDGHSVKVPMNVMNLGDTTRKEYRSRSNATLSHNSTIQASLLKFQMEFLKASGEMEQIVKIKNLSSSMNIALKSAYSKVAESEAALGLLEIDVSCLRQRLEQLEQKEMRQILEMEERKRLQEDEDRKKQDAQEDAEDKMQLEKLLNDLGIYKDGNSRADNTYDSIQPSSLEHVSLNDFIPESFDIVQLPPSLPLESFVHVSSIINSADTSEHFPATLVSDEKVTSGKKELVNNLKIGTSETQNEKSENKPSDPFAFIEGELQRRKNTDSKKPQGLGSPSTSKTSSVFSNKVSGEGKKEVTDNSDKNINVMENFSKVKSSIAGPNELQINGVPTVNGSLAYNEISMADAEPSKSPLSQSNSHAEHADNHTPSSSPVF